MKRDDVKHKGKAWIARKKIKAAREKAKAMQEPGAWAKEAMQGMEVVRAGIRTGTTAEFFFGSPPAKKK